MVKKLVLMMGIEVMMAAAMAAAMAAELLSALMITVLKEHIGMVIHAMIVLIA